MNPLVTIYIPCHNHAEYVGAAIDSVLTQTYRNWELMIFNDGSDDNSKDIIDRYKSYPKVRVFDTNGIGLPKVANLALKNSRGDYFIRLDGDDVFDENILLILVNYLEQNADMAFVFPDYYLMDRFGENFLYEKRELVFDENYMVDAPPHGACTLFRTSIMREKGGYREDLGAQDGLDVWSRIKDTHMYGNVNLPLFYYRQHGSNLTGNKSKIFSARQAIKRDAIESKLDRYRPIIGVIPCREHFDFMQNLWSVDINGKSLLDLAIESCLSCDLFDHVVVTCDNLKVEEVVKEQQHSKLKWHPRDTESTVRNSKLTPVLKEIVEKYDENKTGILVTRFIQSPFVSVKTVTEAISSLILNDATSSVGVLPIKNDLYKRTAHGMIKINQGSKFLSDFDLLYSDLGTVKATTTRVVSRGSTLGGEAVCFEISEKESRFVNSAEDLLISELIDQVSNSD